MIVTNYYVVDRVLMGDLNEEKRSERLLSCSEEIVVSHGILWKSDVDSHRQCYCFVPKPKIVDEEV